MTVNAQDKRRPQHATIKVLIVDDHPLFREGLELALTTLSDDIIVTGQSPNGEEAIRMMLENEPDVVLLDINLPGMNGLQVAKRLKSERLSVAPIILTNHDETQQFIQCFRAGAMAYCLKTIEPDELISVIHDVVQGYRVIGGRRMTERELEVWLTEQIQNLTGAAYMIDPQERYIPLSSRETEILQFVTHGLSNKEIALHLGISQQTVKNHMTSILSKLNVKDRTQAAVTALKHGWVRKPQS
ncbi:MAG: response regulator transcription factor [Armatimonadetes bacterium]|nr:response regulator transcription factor [Anaerolineae bacterium]